jgi:hypothetical protein
LSKKDVVNVLGYTLFELALGDAELSGCPTEDFLDAEGGFVGLEEEAAAGQGFAE